MKNEPLTDELNVTPPCGDKVSSLTTGTNAESTKTNSTVSQEQRVAIIRAIEERNRRLKRGEINWKPLFWRTTINATHGVKRAFDIFLSGMGILCLSPVFFCIALAIRLESSGGIIYRQVRVGKDGRYFNFYKFRSMYPQSDQLRKKLMAQNESQDGVIFKMHNDPRITRVGRFLRKFSLDELPQLFNVLIGDMSLVGPRPPLPCEVQLYTLEERKRLHVLPGITCIWQVSGRSDIPFKEQVKLDKDYISSQSLWRDFLILLKTIPAVLTGKGAY